MNLYRSFGNLMEAWVTEVSQSSDSEWLGNNGGDSPTPSSDMGTNLRSESVDSGVETASSDTSFHAISCSVLTENAEIDTFTAEREGDGPTSASTSRSPVLSSPGPSLTSSSSPRLCPNGSKGGSSALKQKVEQALQRIDSKHTKNNPEPLTVDDVLRRRPKGSLMPKRNISESLRGQRSGSFGLRTVGTLPSGPMRRRPMSMICVASQPSQKRSEDPSEELGKGLSPGLHYLEQVCQMLEEIAKQQMNNQASQMELNATREHRGVEVSKAPDACQSDSKAAAAEEFSCERLENTGSAATQPQSDSHKRYIPGHFRRRSASDTTLATQHLRKFKADCRGQQLNTDDVLETFEEDCEAQEEKKEESNKTKKNWKLRIGSLGRGVSAMREMKGQQMQSSEKNSGHRRLSQLFRSRNRRKTQPV